ncbi:hypothetical protein AB0O86_35995 [Streptomyces hirsutus]|uniref:hypothetical protein n=1 Tax=Streptomyces hirsutus TaxID=35620 RepID=UPI003421D1F0
MCGEFGGDAAFGGTGRGGEGVGGCPEAGIIFVGVMFAGALGFAGAAATAFSLAGWVVAAFVDLVAGPLSGAVDGGAGGEVALDGVGADGARVDAEDYGGLRDGEEVVGVFAGRQWGDRFADEVGLGLGEDRR